MKVMFFTRFICYLMLLVTVSVITNRQASAQAEPAFHVENKIMPLKVGDKVPQLLWDTFFSVASVSADERQQLRLREYKDKLIILDFWAPWCGSCLIGLEKLNKWKTEFSDNLVVFPVTSHKSDEVLEVFSKRNWSFTSVIEDTLLKKYFPHRLIPHLVVIRRDSVIAITSGRQLTPEIISDLIQGNKSVLRTKTDRIAFNRNEIFLRNDSIIKQSLVYGSGFFNQIPGTTGVVGLVTNPDYTRFYLINKSIMDFYFAVIDPSMRNRVFFEIDDPGRVFPDSTDMLDREGWNIDNTYCYELVIPPDIPEEKSRLWAKADFDRYFELSSALVKREMDCYVVKTPDTEAETPPADFIIPEGTGLRSHLKPSWNI